MHLTLTACGDAETTLTISRWKDGLDQPLVDSVIYTPLSTVKEVEFNY